MLLLATTALLGCEPLGHGAGPPEPANPPAKDGRLRVEPTELDFGTRSVLQDGPSSATLWVSNVGEGQLQVLGMDWIPGDSPFSSDAPAVFDLEPGEQRAVELRFEPLTEGSWTTGILPNGAVRVTLTGAATAPVARIFPASDGILTTSVGCDGISEVVLLNDGSEPLRLEALAATGEFALAGALPAELAAGSTTTVPLAFSPSVGGLQATTVTLSSNDPLNPSTGFVMQALGVPGERIVARVAYEPSVPVDILIAVDSGTESATALAAAQAEAQAFFNALEDADVLWQLTVVNGQGCHSTYVSFLDASTWANPKNAGLAMAYGLNPDGGGDPGLLDLANQALADSASGGCLEGFRREGVPLQTVLIGARTDDSASPDWSSLGTVSAVTGQGGACPDGGAAREAAQASGGADVDICGADWEEVWTTLAKRSAQEEPSPFEVELAEAPVPSSVEVRAQGRLLGAWTLEGGVVRIDGVAEGLSRGDEIEVTALAAQECN